MVENVGMPHGRRVRVEKVGGRSWVSSTEGAALGAQAMFLGSIILSMFIGWCY